MQRINYAKTHDSDSTPHGSTARVHVSFATVEPGAADAALSSRAWVSALPSGLSAAIATRCAEGVEALWICTMDCVAILGRWYARGNWAWCLRLCTILGKDQH